VLQYIITGLQKLAATRDVAIVVLTQCATKMQAERGAALIPAINANVWEQGIPTRLVLFRDWIQDGLDSRSLRFVGIQKIHGKGSKGLAAGPCAFKIEPVSPEAPDADSAVYGILLNRTGLLISARVH
jgi:hypothetical protein